MKNKTTTICNTISTLLFAAYVVICITDYINYNPVSTSAPYYVNILINGLFLLIPAIIVFVIGLIVRKKQ